MKSSKNSSSANSWPLYFWLFSMLVTSLFVLPFSLLDPIILPKLMILTPCVFLILSKMNTLKFSSIPRIELIIYFLFLVAIFVSTIVGSRPTLDKIFGEYRRGNGAFFWICILGVYLIGRSFNREKHSMKFLKFFWTSTLVNGLYGLLQSYGWDPIPWTSGREEIGFLGNSNFLTSFVAMGASSGIPFVVDPKSNSKLRLSLLFLLTLSAYLSLLAESLQGILVVLVSVAFFIGIKLKSRNISRILQGILALATISALAGFALISPKLTFLYSSYSVTQRLDYMRTGVRVIQEFPITGIGLDSFADFYPQYRGIEAANRVNAALTDSAHSVPIDVWLSGGILLFASFIGLILLVFVRIYKKVSSEVAMKTSEISLMLIFIGYVVQAMISINHLVIAMWAFAAAGLSQNVSDQIEISNVSISRKNRELSQLVKDKAPKKMKRTVQITISAALCLFVSTTMAVAVAKDAQLRRVLESNRPEQVLTKVDGWPRLKYHFVMPALVLMNSGREDLAIVLARRTLEVYPTDVDSLQLLIRSSLSSRQEKLWAKERMKVVSPGGSHGSE
jgi:O-antigen ligase